MTAGILYFAIYVYLDITNKETEAGGRHTGGLYNANFLSFVGAVVCCSAIYYLCRNLQKNGKKHVEAIVISIFSTLLGLVLVASGNSRSAIIIVVASALTIAYVLAKNSGAKEKEGRRKQMIALLFLSVLVTVAVLLLINRYTSILVRFSFEDGNANQFSSGRLGLWSSYARHLNLLGHDMSSVDWNALTAGVITRHAHNNFLEFSYRCGVPIGIIVIAFQLIAGILTLKIMFGERRIKGYEVFTIVFSEHYLVLSLIDVATIPMTNYAAFFFYICVTPLLMTRDFS